MPQAQGSLSPLIKSYLNGPTDFDLIESTVSKHLDYIVRKYPTSSAVIVCHQHIHWTYAELQQKAQSIALGLLSIGIKTGDRVGIWSPNNIEWVLIQYATAYIGAVMVCINPAYREYELEYALNFS